MKYTRLFLAFTLFTLLFFTMGSPLSARAAEDPNTVLLKIDNKTGQAVYLNLKGPKSYYQTVAPGITKLDIEKGKYSYTYYACGGYQKGTIEVKKTNTKLILPSCAPSKSGKSGTVKFKVNNKTGQAVYLNLEGPMNYYLSLGPGVTRLEVEKGKYKYTYYACEGYQNGSNEVKKANTTLTLPSCGANTSGKFKTVRIRIDNKTSAAVYLNLKGPTNYYHSLAPGVTKLDVEKGKYSYTYYACGAYQNGKIEVKKTNTKLVLPCCGCSSSGKNKKMMKFTVVNDTGGYITLKLTGPQDYSFSLPRGRTVLEVVKGKYKYTAWGCGGSSDSGNIRSGNKLRFICVP